MVNNNPFPVALSAARVGPQGPQAGALAAAGNANHTQAPQNGNSTSLAISLAVSGPLDCLSLGPKEEASGGNPYNFSWANEQPNQPQRQAPAPAAPQAPAAQAPGQGPGQPQGPGQTGAPAPAQGPGQAGEAPGQVAGPGQAAGAGGGNPVEQVVMLLLALLQNLLGGGGAGGPESGAPGRPQPDGAPMV